MASVLLSWVGSQDLRCVAEDRPSASPLVQVARHLKPSRMYLLWCETPKTSLSLKDEGRVKEWFRRELKSSNIKPSIEIVGLSNRSDRVMDFGWVYGEVERLMSRLRPSDEISANASSGTPIMAVAWIVRSRAVPEPLLRLYTSSAEQGVQALALPEKLNIDMESILGVGPPTPLMRQYLESDLWNDKEHFRDFLGDSDSMKMVKARAQIVAEFADVPVLIFGAPGTGKSHLARLIHELSGRKGEFIEIDCGHLSGDTEVHSIFGWAKGAFTGAAKENKGVISDAKDGTLFLDEIGNLPIAQQAKLLRFLQEKTYRMLGDNRNRPSSARIVAATNADIPQMLRDKAFRQDLFDRLRCVTIEIPSLSTRKKDIFPIAKQKLKAFQEVHAESMERAGMQKLKFGTEVERVLRTYDWPGNVRELEHVIARLVIFSDRGKSTIGPADVKAQLDSQQGTRHGGILHRPIGEGFSLEGMVKEVQRHYVMRAAEQTKGNKSEMARLLGYGSSRTPVHTLLEKLEIDL